MVYLPVFTVVVIGATFLWTWLRLKSGSIWPCVMLHAAHNTFLQRFFEPLTRATERTWYYSTEFGIGVLVLAIVLMVYSILRRADVDGARASAVAASGL